MKKARTCVFLFVLVSFFSPPALMAQVPDAGEAQFFDMTGFPQWSRDLRRGSIIAFGAFPFAYLISNWSFDFYRFANNSWDRRFAPFPFAAAGAVEKTQGEMFMTIGLSAGVAIVIALVDHGIVRSRRNRLAMEERARQEETEIIIRRQLLYGPGAETPLLEIPENEEP